MTEIEIEKFTNFQRKRMLIFRELVKKFWHGEIKDSGDLEKITEEIRDKYGFSATDIPFIKDHIRIAMGLDPTGKGEFSTEIDQIKNHRAVQTPVISKLDEACKHCEDQKGCQEACKYEAQLYRRTQGPVIENNKCLSCGQCVTGCDFGALADKIEFIPLIDLLQDEDTEVYAAVQSG